MDLGLLQIADYLGVFVFALSGALAASRKQMDLFGILVVSMLPAIGGGTLRDIILAQPVFWLDDPVSILIACAAGLVVYFIGDSIEKLKTLIWMDALGLALFAAVGSDKTAALGFGPVIIIMMGTITASFGGMIRDIVCNEIPLIFQRDIYATAALIGSAAFWISSVAGAQHQVAFAIAFFVAFMIRAAVLVRGTGHDVAVDAGPSPERQD